MKERLKKYKTFWIVLLAILVTFALNLNPDIHTDITYSFTGNSIVLVAYFLLTYWLLRKVIDIKNKRLKICTAILAVLFASFEIVGNSLNTYMNLDGILLNEIAILKSLIRFAGYFVIIYAILINIFDKLEKQEFITGKAKWFTSNKKSFFIVWAIIFVAWIPYFLNYYPGVITPDSMGQICQSIGVNTLTNHHPIFHTFLISISG